MDIGYKLGKLHKLISISSLDKVKNISIDIKNDYIITLKSEDIIPFFKSYEEFKNKFLKKYSNIDIYNADRIYIRNSDSIDLVVSDINNDETFLKSINKNSSVKYIIFSGIVLTDIDESNPNTSIISFKPVRLSTLEYLSPPQIKTTLNEFNNLYNLSLNEDIKIDNVKIL